MMQAIKFLEAAIHLSFRNLRNRFILVISGFMMHQPHHPAPEPIGPPIDFVGFKPSWIIYDAVIMCPVNGGIRNFISRLFTHPVHFRCDLVDDRP
ncbi:hypothetical protein D3C72_2082070 [compost metagenome]